MRQCEIKKVSNEASGINFHCTQEATEHQVLVELSKHLVKSGLYFMSKPNGTTPCIVYIAIDNQCKAVFEVAFCTDPQLNIVQNTVLRLNAL